MLNLLRGSGLLGASGMPEMRLQALLGEDQHITLFRPLFAVPRSLVLAYAQQYDLRWIEDESNTDTAFTRNFLRHEVLPVIEQRFPALMQKSRAPDPTYVRWYVQMLARTIGDVPVSYDADMGGPDTPPWYVCRSGDALPEPPA